MNTRRSLSRHIYFLSILALILGFFVMMAINTYRVDQQQELRDNQEVINYIKNKEAENTALEQQLTEIRAEIEAFRSAQAESTHTSSLLSSQLSALTRAAGLTALSGPGLVFRMDDNKVGAELAQKANPATYNAENFIIHDKDILYLIREVAPYAEAVAINNIRLVDTTSIRCVGTVIMVNSARLAPPYEIVFLGDAAAIEQALTGSSRYHRLQYMSMPISMEKKDELTVPAYSGSYKPVWSELAEEPQVEE